MTRIVRTHYRYKRHLMVSALCAMLDVALTEPALSADNRSDGIYTGKRVLTMVQTRCVLLRMTYPSP